MAQFLCREGLLVYRDRNELQRIFQFIGSKDQLKRVLLHGTR